MTREEIFAVVKANIQMVIEGTRGLNIQESNSMRDYGADSLEMVEVVSRSMKQLKVKVPRTELLGARNLKDLTDVFEKAIALQGEPPSREAYGAPRGGRLGQV